MSDIQPQIKIIQRMRGISVDKIQKIEKEAIESTKTIYINETGVPGNFKDLK